MTKRRFPHSVIILVMMELLVLHCGAGDIKRALNGELITTHLSLLDLASILHTNIVVIPGPAA